MPLTISRRNKPSEKTVVIRVAGQVMKIHVHANTRLTFEGGREFEIIRGEVWERDQAKAQAQPATV